MFAEQDSIYQRGEPDSGGGVWGDRGEPGENVGGEGLHHGAPA